MYIFVNRFVYGKDFKYLKEVVLLVKVLFVKVENNKYLGITISSNLYWSEHIEAAKIKWRGTGALSRIFATYVRRSPARPVAIAGMKLD